MSLSTMCHVDRSKRYYLPEHLGMEEEPSLVTDRAPRSRLYEVHRVIAHRVTPEVEIIRYCGSHVQTMTGLQQKSHGKQNHP